MITRSRKITIDKFIELWDKIHKKKYDDIVPSLPNKIFNLWKWQISERFYQVKLYGSEGSIPFNQLPYYIRAVSDMKEVPPFYLPRKAYASRSYMKEYPMTFVKTGDLKSMMLSNMPYDIQAPGNTGELRVRVDIPLYDDPSLPDTYMILEEQRSYIKSSFIMAWPKILHEIMEELSK